MFWHWMFNSLTQDIKLHGKPELMRRRFNRALDVAEMLGTRRPDLTVDFAAKLHALDWHGYARARSAALVYHHAEAAWAIDPAATQRALESAASATRDYGAGQTLLGMLYRLAPELEPGPWGCRPHGIPDDWVLHL